MRVKQQRYSLFLQAIYACWHFAASTSLMPLRLCGRARVAPSHNAVSLMLPCSHRFSGARLSFFSLARLVIGS